MLNRGAAAELLGMSELLLMSVPYRELPFTSAARDRWYRGDHLEAFKAAGLHLNRRVPRG